MTINYQFGDVDAHGAMIRALAGSLEAEHQAIISDVLTASDFWGGAGSAACQGFITQLGRNFQVIYEQANAHGQKVRHPGHRHPGHRHPGHRHPGHRHPCRQQHGTNRQRRRLQLGLKLA